LFRYLEVLYLRPENGWVELEVNEICAICDAEFVDEKELKEHLNEIHRKSMGPTKPSRSAPPPKRLANQMFEEYDSHVTKHRRHCYMLNGKKRFGSVVYGPC
jgi:uncharacterized C2H2 Zn-finger protein